MKNVIGFMLVCLMIVCAESRANLLTDPGFENSGGGSWNPYTSHANFEVNFDQLDSTNCWSGLQSLGVTWASTIPQWNIFEARQDVAVTEGALWEASVRAKTASNLNGAETYLETIFYDSGMSEVGKIKSDSLTGYTEWTLLSNSGVVSNNAVTARFRLIVFTTGGDSSSGNIYFDETSAVIPEPSSGVLLLGSLGVVTILIRRWKSA